MVNSEDHFPAHVHVIKDGYAILIRLDNGRAYKAKGKPSLAVMREAERIVADHLTECRAEWKKWHG